MLLVAALSTEDLHWLKPFSFLSAYEPLYIATIAVQDLEIQRRENDVVLGTFGRGFYVLDDYSPLRSASEELLTGEPVLFGVKDAPLYVERSRLGQSSTHHQPYRQSNCRRKYPVERWSGWTCGPLYGQPELDYGLV